MVSSALSGDFQHAKLDFPRSTTRKSYISASCKFDSLGRRVLEKNELGCEFADGAMLAEGSSKRFGIAHEGYEEFVWAGCGEDP